MTKLFDLFYVQLSKNEEEVTNLRTEVVRRGEEIERLKDELAKAAKTTQEQTETVGSTKSEM